MNPLSIAEAAAWTLTLCDRIAAETDVDGEITRLFLSPAAARVQTLLGEEMQRLGMAVRVDAGGNLRGTLACTTADASTLLLGSHVDTVPNAGRYDGILGVALALGTLQTLSHPLPFHVEVIAFSEEEGVRFRMPFIGSRASTGTLNAADLDRKDAGGVSVREALAGFGLDPLAPGIALMTPGMFAFVEVHIEQGPVLESLGLSLGVVESIIGQSRYELTFHGQANHAGTTPMEMRQDALVTAARFITQVEEYARGTASLVATVGTIQALPGAPNIIPGAVTLSLDVRHPDDAMREGAVAHLLDRAAQIAAERGLRLTHRETSAQAATRMDTALTSALAAAARDAGVAAHRMHSGAGHDAMILAPHVPAAMLFLRTPHGLSHHPEEAVAREDAEAAILTMRSLLQHLP